MGYQRYAKIRAQRVSQWAYSPVQTWPQPPTQLPNPGPTDDIAVIQPSGVIQATQMPSLTKPAVVVANESELAKYKNPIPDMLLSPIATSDGSRRFTTYDPRGPPKMDLPEASSTMLAGKSSVGQAEFYVQRDSHNYGLEG